MDTIIKLLGAYPAVVTVKAILWRGEDQALLPRLLDHHVSPNQAGAGGGVLDRSARTRSCKCALGAPYAACDYTLFSTSGVVVVSTFLSVVLPWSPAGGLSVDWDYEYLLSMDTHLRVTRVGRVKWRGCHSNGGADGSHGSCC